MNTTKAKERFEDFKRNLANTYPMQRSMPHPQYDIDIWNFLESELLLSHQAGREEMRQECLQAVPKEMKLEIT